MTNWELACSLAHKLNESIKKEGHIVLTDEMEVVRNLLIGDDTIRVEDFGPGFWKLITLQKADDTDIREFFKQFKIYREVSLEEIDA